MVLGFKKQKKRPEKYWLSHFNRFFQSIDFMMTFLGILAMTKL